MCWGNYERRVDPQYQLCLLVGTVHGRFCLGLICSAGVILAWRIESCRFRRLRALNLVGFGRIFPLSPIAVVAVIVLVLFSITIEHVAIIGVCQYLASVPEQYHTPKVILPPLIHVHIVVTSVIRVMVDTGAAELGY